MPQFDFFIWFSLSFTTIFIFQISYLSILYLIVARVARIQKTLIKLYLKKKQKQKLLINFLDNSFSFYFFKLKLKQNLQSNLNKVISKDKNFFLKKKLSLKNINFKKPNTFIKKYYKIKIKNKLEVIPIKSNITKVQTKKVKKKGTKNIKQIPIELITENIIKKETKKSTKGSRKNSKKKNI